MMFQVYYRINFLLFYIHSALGLRLDKDVVLKPRLFAQTKIPRYVNHVTPVRHKMHSLKFVACFLHVQACCVTRDRFPFNGF